VVRLWVALDVHKLSIVAAWLPAEGGDPVVERIESTERAIRRFVGRVGGPEGLAVCYEAGPGGFDLYRLLRSMGVACDVVAPSLIPVRAGDRVKTDPRELASWLGITPTEYSSGHQQHRGHITRTGNEHARRLLVEAAWHYRHPPRRSARAPEPDARAWQAQVRLSHRWRQLTSRGKRSTVANVAVARELAGFIWAAMTDQPTREEAAA